MCAVEEKKKQPKIVDIYKKSPEEVLYLIEDFQGHKEYKDKEFVLKTLSRELIEFYESKVPLSQTINWFSLQIFINHIFVYWSMRALVGIKRVIDYSAQKVSTKSLRSKSRTMLLISPTQGCTSTLFAKLQFRKQLTSKQPKSSRKSSHSASGRKGKIPHIQRKENSLDSPCSRCR